MNRRLIVTFVLFLIASLLAPAMASIGVSRVELTDDGDHDGYADPRETVALRLTLTNRSARDLTGITAWLVTDSTFACVTQPVVTLEELPAWSERAADPSVILVIGDVHRASLGDPLSVAFDLVVTADQLPTTTLPRAVELDLDIDVGGGSGATSFFENFEDGFGGFAPMPLDTPLNPPADDLGNIPAGAANADGYRCQYSDPSVIRLCIVDGVEVPCFTECFPNATGHPDAFSGGRSVYFGESLDGPLGFTTPTAQLEAIRSTEPVNLAWRDVCSESGTDCAADLDCPVGEACIPVKPELLVLRRHHDRGGARRSGHLGPGSRRQLAPRCAARGRRRPGLRRLRQLPEHLQRGPARR